MPTKIDQDHSATGVASYNTLGTSAAKLSLEYCISGRTDG